MVDYLRKPVGVEFISSSLVSRIVVMNNFQVFSIFCSAMKAWGA